MACIQDLTDSCGLLSKTAPARRALLLEQRIVVCDNYAGAALALHAHGFINAAVLRQAVQGCNDEFEALAPLDFETEDVYFARRNELARDIRSVDEVLATASSAFSPIATRINDADDTKWWRM